MTHLMENPDHAAATASPVAVFADGQAPVVRFAGRTLTKGEAEQLAHELLDAVTEIDTAYWQTNCPELVAYWDAQPSIEDLDDELLERIAS